MAININLESFSPIKVTRTERNPSKNLNNYNTLSTLTTEFGKLSSESKEVLQTLYNIFSNPIKVRKVLAELSDWYNDFKEGTEITYTLKDPDEVKELPLEFATALVKELGSNVMYFYIDEAIEDDKSILKNEKLQEIYTKKFIKEIVKEITPYYIDYKPGISIFDYWYSDWYSGIRSSNSLLSQHELIIRRLGKVVQRLEDYLKQVNN